VKSHRFAPAVRYRVTLIPLPGDPSAKGSEPSARIRDLLRQAEEVSPGLSAEELLGALAEVERLALTTGSLPVARQDALGFRGVSGAVSEGVSD